MNREQSESIETLCQYIRTNEYKDKVRENIERENKYFEQCENSMKLTEEQKHRKFDL